MLLDHLSITITTSRFCTKASFTFWKKRVIWWHSSSWAYDTVQSPGDCRVFKFRQLSWHELLSFMILCHRPPCDTTQGVLMIRKKKCQRFSILFWAPCDSQLRCKSSTSCSHSSSERVCMALSLQCQRILLWTPTSWFSFGNTWKQHHPALSCCAVKATGTTAWHPD